MFNGLIANCLTIYSVKYTIKMGWPSKFLIIKLYCKLHGAT